MPSPRALAAFVSISAVAQSGAAATPARDNVRIESKIVECPSLSEVEVALHRFLGDGEPSAGAWVLSYRRDPSVSGSDGDRSLIMEFVAPSGQRLLERRIPATLGDCGAVASAMAAVVERSLRQLGWTRGDPLPRSVQKSRDPEPDNAKRPNPDSGRAEGRDPEPDNAKRPNPDSGRAEGRNPESDKRESGANHAARQDRLPRLILGAGLSMETSTVAANVQTNLLVESRICAFDALCLRLSAGLLPSSDSEPVSAVGTVRVSSYRFTVAPLWAAVVQGVELAGGPAFLLGFDHGSSEGIEKVERGDRQTLAAGLAVAVAVRISPRWRLGVGLEGFHSALGPDFVVEVDGSRAEVLAPAPWQGMASAQLEFVAWP